MKNSLRFILLSLTAALLLSGCNTTRGIGQDIQDMGHIISRAAS
ncbi:entericidin A [Salmonella enterica subsp. enterica serovar Choleraesuis]|nr:entericidin A [Salmonella enterica subsp. enterica serovar Choleraesuis]